MPAGGEGARLRVGGRLPWLRGKLPRGLLTSSARRDPALSRLRKGESVFTPCRPLPPHPPSPSGFRAQRAAEQGEEAPHGLSHNTNLSLHCLFLHWAGAQKYVMVGRINEQLSKARKHLMDRSIILLQYCTTCTTVLLYYCTIVLLHYCITVLRIWIMGRHTEVPNGGPYQRAAEQGKEAPGRARGPRPPLQPHLCPPPLRE